MPVQIFLQGKIAGIEEFLLAPTDSDQADRVFAGRSHWISLLSEILPRALLAEHGLAKILLGSSGGGQFLLVLPEEVRTSAEEFLTGSSKEISALSGGLIRLTWAVTENLGDWSDVRKRLTEEMQRLTGAPGWTGAGDPVAATADGTDYFAHLGWKLRDAEAAGWSPETPGRVLIGEGKHGWKIGRAHV